MSSRSTVDSRSHESSAPARARRSSWSTRPSIRAVSWSMSLTRPRPPAQSWSLAVSSCTRRLAIGLRSSWAASATKRRWFSALSWRRPSIWLTVRARRPISSCCTGVGTRRSRLCPEMASARVRIAFTGASARPMASHITAASTPTRRERPIPPILVAALIACSTSWTGTATKTVAVPVGVSTPCATTRYGPRVRRQGVGTPRPRRISPGPALGQAESALRHRGLRSR